MTTSTAPAQVVDERLVQVGLIKRLLSRPEFGALVALIIVWVFFAIVAFENAFVSLRSTAAILNAAAPLGIMAIAVALLMIAGDFDLSIGSVLGFAGMVVMMVVTPTSGGGFGLNIWVALGIALLVALAVGFINGLLVVATKLPSFIVTLASLFIFRGLAVAQPRQRTNRTQLGGLDQAEGYDLAGALFGTKIRIGNAGFDIAIVWMIVFGAVATWVLLRTRQGNWIFGIGGDSNAARNVGVPVNRMRIALFMTTAFAGFLAAVLQAVQFNGSDSLRGEGQEFEAIIAVVVGGTLLTGGYGSVVGAVLGAVIFAMVKLGIVITGVDGDWYRVFLGAVLVLAVIFNQFIRLRATKR